MANEGPLLPQHKSIPAVDATTASAERGRVVFTRDHALIRDWAQRHGAEPATGEATRSGPATVNVQDGGAGVRFNFPGASVYRPISWDEWLANFDTHECAFVFENEEEGGRLSNRYRIVNAGDWKEFLG
jgi:hypothetical protein